MCGIFGSINFALDDSEVKQSLLSINHRGPDSNGIFRDNNHNHSLIFGHNRLEILDLKMGSQPMVSEDKQYVVIFNGEIYNFDELRRDLKNKGHKFITNNSDTEVLIHGYKEWGENLSKYLNGMWVFAIYDKVKKKIFLSRDRFGEKPLFYYIKKNVFIFSSELSGISCIKKISLTLNKTSLHKYCAYGFFPFQTSPYNNIFKLEAGKNLSLNLINMNYKIYKYWDYNIEPDYKTSENDWCEQIYNLLNNSVKKRLVADVPIGIFLSGGLDSSIISYLAQKNNKNQISTFSIGFEENTFDETKYSDYFAKKINSKHFHHFINSPNLLNIYEDFRSKINEPISDSSLLSYFQLCKFARQSVKVCLGGDAADELFAGYDTFKAIKFLNIIKTLKLNKLNPFVTHLLSKLPSNYGYMNYKFKLNRFCRFSGNNIATAHGQWLSPLTNNDIFELFNQKVNNEEIYSEAIDLWEKNKNLNNIDNSLQFYAKIFLQDQILVKTDRLSMLNSLEVRSPFLDYDLVDCIRKIPSNLKLKGRTSKYILKKTFEKHLGKKFTHRKKVGFSAPISKWLNDNKDLLKINSNFLKNKNQYIQEKFNEHLSFKNENRILLWNVMNLDNFLHKNGF